MISAIPLAAVAKTLSAYEKASENFKLPQTSRNFSLLITSNESTYFSISLIPSTA